LEARALETEETLKKMSFQEKMRFFNSSFTGGFSQYISSSTLRNENLAFSFPKGPRSNNVVRLYMVSLTKPEFVHTASKETAANSEGSESQTKTAKIISQIDKVPGTIYEIPTTMKSNATCFGIGEKKASYIFHKGTPSPSHYQVKRIYETVNQVQKVA
jgi:hypothetical protein